MTSFNTTVPAATSFSWKKVLPDIAAFLLSLAFAASLGWNTNTLVWSLWATSLVIGYAMILTYVCKVAFTSWRVGRAIGGQKRNWLLRRLAPCAAALVVGGVMLGFFTVHFGMFHFVHSAFLNHFFPIGGEGAAPGRGAFTPSLRDYMTVFASCLWFFPMALVAERAAFIDMFRPEPAKDAQADSRTEARTDAQANAARSQTSPLLRPYRNVVRLHLLIFFFAFAFFIGMGDFWIFLVIYVVYFFPWQHFNFFAFKGKRARETAGGV